MCDDSLGFCTQLAQVMEVTDYFSAEEMTQ